MMYLGTRVLRNDDQVRPSGETASPQLGEPGKCVADSCPGILSLELLSFLVVDEDYVGFISHAICELLMRCELPL